MRSILFGTVLTAAVLSAAGCGATDSMSAVPSLQVTDTAIRGANTWLLDRFAVEDPEQVKITIAYMTAAEWANLNAKADRETMATLQTQGSLPRATLEQIPNPDDITPVLPGRADRELLIVDIRGITVETKVGMDAPKVFDNVQLIYDLRLAAQIDGSMQSPISAFRLEGQQVTPDELEQLLASLEPVETPVPNELEFYPTVDPSLLSTPLPPPQR